MTESEFRQKVMPLRRQMYGLGLRMGISPDDTADAVQEILLRLWRRRDGIPDAGVELRLYCLSAMRNECLTMMRLSRASAPLDATSDIGCEDTDTTEFGDTRQHIETLIGCLPPGQRDAIRLSAFGQLETREIAREMGMTETNVRQLLSRARKKLRLEIGKFGENIK